MKDPYQVLGVSPDASEKDIAQAYRALAKKHHPDLNPNDPNAEKKMQQINAAYEQIKNGSAGASQPGYQDTNRSGNPYGNDPYGRQQDNPYAGTPFEDLFGEFFSGGAYEQQSRYQQQRSATHSPSPEMRAVNNLVSSSQYPQAVQTLSRMNERNAEWYFYSALAHAGMDNRVTALNHAREAVRKEPGNETYNELLDQFEAGGFDYQQAGRGYGFDMTSASSSMMRLCLANLCCMMFCRPC